MAAAITATTERPRALVRLRVDWNRSGSFTDLAIKDLSADVVSVDLSRDLTTDIPPQAKLFTGAAAAQATITLATHDPAGDPVKHAAWKYSPLNGASPLTSYKRKGAPATLEFGFNTSAGDQYVTVLTGTVRSLQVTSGGRQAVMLLEDRSATMRRQVQLPMIIADGAIANIGGAPIIKPGLNTTFLADWVARACGYYASPPARADCRMLATHHGSGHPEVGVLQHHHGHTGGQIAYAPTSSFSTAAKWVQAAGMNGNSGQEVTYILGGAGGVSTNNGGELLWEGWRLFNTTAADQPLFIAYDTGSATPYVSAFWQSSTSRFAVTFNRGGADTDHSTGTSGPSVSPGTSSWHYWAVQVGFNSTGADVTFRFDGTTTGPINIATGSFTGIALMDTVGLGRGKISAFANGFSDAWIEADQLTGESTTSTWNNAFVPTAQIVPSGSIDNRLVATPHVTEDGWDLFQEIAESEFATAGFIEGGTLFYWSRKRWVTAPYTTSQRTLSSSTALTELESVEAIDQVRNRIVIRSRAPNVEDLQTVWKLGSRWTIPASGSITKIAELNDPVGNVDTSVAYGTTPGSSRYLAGDRLDGQGNQVSNLTIGVVVLGPTTLQIQITNPNAFTVYMAGDENASAAQSGKPYLWIDAQVVRFGEEAGSNSNTRVEASDATSISNYGEQLLEIEDNDFRQDDDDIQVLANDLRTDLADPGPAMADVPIVGDPRLQLGDRVTIVDPEGLAMSADFHLSKCDLSFADGKLSGTISLRSA